MFLRVLGMRLHKCCFWDFININTKCTRFSTKSTKGNYAISKQNGGY